MMDMSFANQALGSEFMLAHAKDMQPRVYTLPAQLDTEIARIKLHAMGIASIPCLPSKRPTSTLLKKSLAHQPTQARDHPAREMG